MFFPKWKEVTFSIAVNSEAPGQLKEIKMEPVKGYRMYELVIYGNEFGWTITHIPSGMVIAHVLTEEQARDLTLHISHLDWSTLRQDVLVIARRIRDDFYAGMHS